MSRLDAWPWVEVSKYEDRWWDREDVAELWQRWSAGPYRGYGPGVS